MGGQRSKVKSSQQQVAKASPEKQSATVIEPSTPPQGGSGTPGIMAASTMPVIGQPPTATVPPTLLPANQIPAQVENQLSFFKMFSM